MKLLWIILLFSTCWACTDRKSVKPLTTPIFKSNEKEILGDPEIVGVIGVQSSFDRTTKVVELTVPASTDIKALKLRIKISAKASISPDPSQSHDYSSPIVFTVTAEDNSRQDYTIRIVKNSTPDKMCRISRIASDNDKQYFNFRYDQLSRVVEMELFDEFLPMGKDPIKIAFKYNTTGDVILAEMPMPEVLGGGMTIYKPIYENGKLVRLAERSNRGKESSGTIKLDNNNRFMGFKSTQCNLFVEGAVTEIIDCNSGFIYNKLEYTSRTWHFLTAQQNYPAFLSIYYSFLAEFDNTNLLTHIGKYLPTKRTSYRLPGSAIWERANVKYKVNEYGYPSEITVVTEKKLDTDFPYTNTSVYILSYENCQE